MKKLFKYFLMFIALFLFVELITNWAMREKEEDIYNIIIKVDSPKIEVSEAKTSGVGGYIKGNITNDTGNHLRDKHIQFYFFDKDGAYLGEESKELNIFNIDENSNFEIQFKYKNVDKVEIDFVDEVIKPEVEGFNFLSFLDLDLNNKDIMKYAIPAGIVLGIYGFIP